MLDVFNEKLLQKELKDVSSDVLLVYLCLRADICENFTATAKIEKNSGKLVSGLGVQSIAQMLGISALTVQRCLQSLVGRGWVKSSGSKYILGEIQSYKPNWYFGSPKKHHEKKRTVIDVIRQKVREKARRDKELADNRAIKLKHETKRKIASKTLYTLVKETKAPSFLLEHFLSRYKELYNSAYPVDFPREKGLGKLRILANNIVRYSDGEYRKAEKIMDFTFDNWDKLEKHFSWTGRLNLNFLATAKIYKQVNLYLEKGIPERISRETTVATRVNKKHIKDSPDEGF